MYFTREPIIETIITPKEGYKLTVRSSKKEDQEDIILESVEMVSFGTQMFYRSQEKSRCFLLPVSDYEIIETREARMVLKAAEVEGDIKIGKPKVIKEEGLESKEDRKRDKKRLKKKKGFEAQEPHRTESVKTEEPIKAIEKPTRELPQPRMIIPPPLTLISENIARMTKELPDEALVDSEPPQHDSEADDEVAVMSDLLESMEDSRDLD